MRSVDPGSGFDSWRRVARGLLQEGVAPEQVLWEGAEQGSLFGGAGAESVTRATEAPPPPAWKVPSAFFSLAEGVSCHADPRRWALLYRLLWRIARGGERELLEIVSDPEVAQARLWLKGVRREIHKMHAFVRFRKAGETAEGRERFVAWFEPEHFVVEAAAPFFRKRFANMDWSIFTPKGCAHWLGEELHFAAGLERDPTEQADALEEIWRTYYRSIFNPARLKLKAMRAEMPRRYWKNLPEAGPIEELSRGSSRELAGMLEEPLRAARPEPKNAYLGKLRELSQAPADRGAEATLAEVAAMVSACRNCPLWERTTGAVPGEGPADARWMIVGEQPGDREDLAGRPFVGPAGQLLDRALQEAGLDRGGAYVTNAVKHFKWTPRGKLRLHQKPAAGEIEACRPWLLAELARVTPQVLILLGATAGRSLLGPGATLARDRGRVEAPEWAPLVIFTVHPSYLLRLEAGFRQDQEYARLVADLRLAAAALAG